LHKGEKRNFKLLTGLLAGGRDKKYIELFDLIDRQDAYNETKLMAHFGDLYGGQFSAGKNYLHKLILKSLVYYDSDPEAEMVSLKSQIRVLVRKELLPPAKKLLKKAIREAESGEYFGHLHDLVSIEMEILMQELSEKRLEDKLENIAETKRRALDLQRNLDEYESLHSRLHILTNDRNVARREQDLEAFRRIAHDPLLGAPEQALSIRAKVEYFSIHAKLAGFRDKLPKAVLHSRQALDLLEAHLSIRNRMQRRYFLEVSSLGINLLRQGRHEEAFAILSQVREMRELYPNVSTDYFPLYYIANITLAIQLGEPERLEPLLEEVEARWNDIHARSPDWHEMLLSYLMAYYYLVIGKPSSGLRWVNLLVNSPRSEHRIYLQAFARLLMLMIHFDLGNYMVVESNLPNVQRFLEKHDRLQPYEEAVLRSIRSMVRLADTPELESVISDRLDEFKVLAQDKFEQRAMSLLDFLQWLQGKQEGRSIAAIRKGNALENESGK
jgi:hypothetical protein